MKEVNVQVDLVNKQRVSKGLLINDNHVIFAFDGQIWLIPNAKIENGIYYDNEGSILLGETEDESLDHLKEIVDKLKSITLLDYFISNKDVLSLDYDFNLTEQ